LENLALGLTDAQGRCVCQPVSPSENENLEAIDWSEADVFDAVACGARNVAIDVIFSAFQIADDLQGFSPLRRRPMPREAGRPCADRCGHLAYPQARNPVPGAALTPFPSAVV
jgi:hypothetical protein